MVQQVLQQSLDNSEVYTILDMINTSIYWKDCNGHYLGCNKHCLEVFGLTNRKQIIGKTDYDFLKTEDADQLRGNDVLAIKNAEFIGEEHLTINGHLDYYSTTKTRLVNEKGDISGTFGTSTCITDIKNKMEQEKKMAVLEEEVKIAQIIDIVPAHIYWKHKNERYIGCNQYQKDTWGFDIAGKSEYDIWPKEEADKIHAMDQYVLEHGNHSGEEVGRDPVDGTTKYYFSSKRQFRNSNGDVIGIVGVSLDITDRKEKEKLATENQINKNLLQQQEQFRKIVDKVVHDVRAPVASIIHLAKNAAMLPEEQRITLRDAGNRVNDLANNLLNYYKPTANDSAIIYKRGPLLVSGAITEILSEKRLQYYGLPVKFEDEFTQSSYFAFINIETDAFKSMLSNLINNSVDAFNGRAGVVTVWLENEVDIVKITIQDNGLGMSHKLIDKIMHNINVTEGKRGGHGIGWAQVRETLQRNNGTFKIESTPNIGTKIILTFSRIKTPNWITTKIELHDNDLIVVLDDDPSIHGAWDSRFEIDAPKLKLEHFEFADDAIKFINTLTPDRRQKIFLLTDYELLQQGLHGLDVVEQTGIKRSILVTSHHENKEIQKQAQKTHTKILPKLLALEVPIAIVPLAIGSIEKSSIEALPAEEPAAVSSVETNTLKSDIQTDNLLQVDMLIVDDNQSFMDSIKNNFFRNKKIDIYYEPHTFLANIHKYAKNTKIFLDNNFDNYMGDITDIHPYNTGFCLARKLHEDGYTGLYLFTGDRFEEDDMPPYLKIIAKSNLEEVQELLEPDAKGDDQGTANSLVGKQQLQDRIIDFMELIAFKQKDYLENIERATNYIKEGHGKFTGKTLDSIATNISVINQLSVYESKIIKRAKIILDGNATEADLMICDLEDSFKYGNLRFGLKSSYNALYECITYGFKYLGNTIIFDLVLLILLRYLAQQHKEHKKKGNIFIRVTKSGKRNRLYFRYEMMDEVSKKHFIPFEQLPDYNSDLEFCKLTMQLFGGDIKLNLAQDKFIEFILSFPKVITDKKIKASDQSI